MVRRSRRGHTLTELLVGMAVMGLLFVVLSWAVTYSQSAVRQATGSQDSSDQLKRATRMLRMDLLQTSRSQISVCNVGAGPIPEGRAVWFLSSIDNLGVAQRDSSGYPLWVKQILYYSLVPQQHDSLAGGIPCQSGLGPLGVEDFCPHKVLIRKEIDLGSSGTLENLLSTADIQPYLTRPQGVDYGAMRSEPGVKKVNAICRSLLFFYADFQLPGVNVDIRAVDDKRAQKEIPLGRVSLTNSTYTQSYTTTIIPETP